MPNLLRQRVTQSLSGAAHVVPGEADIYVRVVDKRSVISASPWDLVHRAAVRINADALRDMLAHPLLPADRSASLLAGIRRVPADSSAGVSVRDFTLNDPWRIPSVRAGDGLAVHVKAVTASLLRAVGTRTEGAAKVGILATGGLDSALIAAIAKTATGTPPLLLTAAGGLTTPTEDRLCEALAQWLGSKRMSISAVPQINRSALLQANRGADFPRGGIFTPVWDQLALCAVDEGCDVVLTGEGGNEVFSPGGALASDLWRARHFLLAAGQFGRVRSTHRPTWLGALREGRASRWVPSKAWRNPSVAHPTWYGAHGSCFSDSQERWVARVDGARRCGVSLSEALTQARLERLELWGPWTRDRPNLFQHPLADPQVAAAVYDTPLVAMTPHRVGAGDKMLERIVSRQFLPAAITEHPKVGPANQVSALLAAQTGNVEWDERSAQFLGLDLDERFRRPQDLPASAGLDWTSVYAFLAWAEANLP